MNQKLNTMNARNTTNMLCQINRCSSCIHTANIKKKNTCGMEMPYLVRLTGHGYLCDHFSSWTATITSVSCSDYGDWRDTVISSFIFFSGGSNISIHSVVEIRFFITSKIAYGLSFPGRQADVVTLY